MDVASSIQAPIGQGTRIVATAVENPRLTKTDAASIQSFLRDYDQYSREIIERAKRLVGDQVTSTETSKPVQVRSCVNAEWLESVVDLCFIEADD